MTEAAFLAAILDDPDDDATRLVFADWLDENGDPTRAELIRLQCALERSPEEYDGPRRRRADDLLSGGLYERLLAPLRALGFDTEPTFGPSDRYTNNPIGWGFRRGLIGSAHVGGGEEKARFFLERADAVFAVAPIQHLAIDPLESGQSDNGFCPWDWSHAHPPISVETLAGLLALAGVRRLRSLDLSGNGLNGRAAALLVESPNLAGLRLLRLGEVTSYTGGYHGDHIPLGNDFDEAARRRLVGRFGDAVQF